MDFTWLPTVHQVIVRPNGLTHQSYPYQYRILYNRIEEILLKLLTLFWDIDDLHGDAACYALSYSFSEWKNNPDAQSPGLGEIWNHSFVSHVLCQLNYKVTHINKLPNDIHHSERQNNTPQWTNNLQMKWLSALWCDLVPQMEEHMEYEYMVSHIVQLWASLFASFLRLSNSPRLKSWPTKNFGVSSINFPYCLRCQRG